MNVEIFNTVPEIIERYKNIYPACSVYKTINEDKELCVRIENEFFISICVVVRASQGSKYFIAEIIDKF